jgi:hypothetical protein
MTEKHKQRQSRLGFNDQRERFLIEMDIVVTGVCPREKPWIRITNIDVSKCPVGTLPGERPKCGICC